jgi:hypothetical protein
MNPSVLCLSLVLGVAAGFVHSQASGRDQPTPPTQASWTAPRTADGHPDLQGVWRNNTATPLERPRRLGNRKFLTQEELQGLNDLVASLTRVADDHASWLGDLDFDNRTSLITDPSNGRLPSLTRRARARVRAETARVAGRRGHDSYEDRPLSERCITFGMPDLLAGYNSYIRIVQTPVSVAISAERIHDVRIVPLDGRPHLSPSVQLWHGDSRGRWEGEVLVVDTTNFSRKSMFRESSEHRRVVERFKRTAHDRLEYEVTIADPHVWSKPWTLMIPLKRTDEQIYEYACHEGNEALARTLMGARGDGR